MALARGVDDSLNIVFAVVLGCTTAAFLSLASLGVAGFEGLLRCEVEGREGSVFLGSMAAKISLGPDKSGKERESGETGGIDEVCECTIAGFLLPSPTAIVWDAMLAKVVGVREGGVVEGSSTSNTLPPPTKPGSENMSDDDGDMLEVCRCSATAFALPCSGSLVTVDEMRVTVESPDSAFGTLEDADPMSVRCPDCVPEIVVEAPGVLPPFIAENPAV